MSLESRGHKYNKYLYLVCTWYLYHTTVKSGYVLVLVLEDYRIKKECNSLRLSDQLYLLQSTWEITEN
jgi:hypothetical protein